MNFIKKLFLLSTVFCTAALLLMTSQNYATDLGMKLGENGKFATLHDIVKPGQTIERYLEIINSGSTPTSGTIIAKDGLQSSDGLYSFIPTEEPNSQAGTWYTLKQSEVALEPGSIKRVDFSLTVPKEIKPGEYGSALAIIEKSNEQLAGNIRVVNRNGLRSLIIVSGESKNDLVLTQEITNLTYTASADNKPAGVTIELKNSGNLFAQSDINYSLQGPNNFYETGKINPDLSPSDKSIQIESKLTPQNLKDGHYTLTYDLTNSPVNRKLASDDFIYGVKVQKIVFEFDSKSGALHNISITKNEKRAQDWNIDKKWTWNNLKIEHIILGGMVVLMIIAFFMYFFIRSKPQKYDTQQTP